MTRLKGFLGTNGRVGWPYQSRVNFGLEKVYAPPSWVRELHNKWFNVLLKGTSASKVADSVAAAHAAGRPPPCTTLLCAEALMPCSMKVNEKRNSWIEKAADLWSTGAVFCLDLCVWRGGGDSLHSLWLCQCWQLSRWHTQTLLTAADTHLL